MDFSSKSKTLENLRGLITSAKVLPQISFTVFEWRNNKDSILNEITKLSKGEQVIVRSSAAAEDTAEESKAGCFLSIAEVETSDEQNITKAIHDVINSFEDEDLENTVFVQPHLQNIILSGVIFSKDLTIGSKYITVNYDDSIGAFDTVTSGNSNELKTLVISKFVDINESDNQLTKKVFEVVNELEGIFQNDELDIEFAINDKNEFFIFQVRPLVAIEKSIIEDVDFKKTLNKVSKKIDKLNGVHPNLCGRKTIFGVMPDWNPAEIIGVRPKALALSLYKELITDNIWAYQRHNYGYRDLRSFPLLISFLGLPYIDVRVSFNSFVPKSVPNDLADKLIDYYINELEKHPNKHDKVEFEIVNSCYSLDLPEKLFNLKENGFSEDELTTISNSLRQLTNNIFKRDGGLYQLDIEKVESLQQRSTNVISSKMSINDKIYWMIEECKRFGTLPFAGLARAAFVAVQMLKSFVKLGVISEQEESLFLSSLKTVAKELEEDLNELIVGGVSQKEFLKKYGHLRPGTYDIESPRYDVGFSDYFDLTDTGQHSNDTNTKAYEFTQSQIDEIDKHLINHQLEISATDLIEFIKTAIEYRERAKFIFTKNLSDTLNLIEDFGAKFGIQKSDMAFVDIQTTLGLYTKLTHEDIGDIFQQSIRRNKKVYEYTKAIKLPHLINQASDIYEFYFEKSEPNYITLKSVLSEILLEQDFKGSNLEDKIVLIESADPGYDWIFTKKISGLITKYGGANSHMAIRCAELSIPAVIGCGTNFFDSWSKAIKLNIDALNKRVIILQ